MYECVGLNKKNLVNFKELNKIRDEFNILNKDFFNIYNKSNFAQQMLLKRKVRLLKRDNYYIGYLWSELTDNNVILINAVNVLNIFSHTYDQIIPYRFLVNTLNKNSVISYNCESNAYNFQILENIGFKKKEGTLMLCLSLLNYVSLLAAEDLKFQLFEKGRDEQKRCEIQNKIFSDDNRIPLTLDDIYFDEIQDYYFDKGSVFLKKDNKYIGYGQIIIENYTPLIVNFGILKEYRGKGYSKALLCYLLNIVKHNGFNKVKLKVKCDNRIALKLYKSVGFKIKSEIYNWELLT
ncbi:N-acetyltransferase [Clostridium sp. DJ247]|uniref:GNAT family N-acetyltransferase n=1 Tax=Clostridium sp. DJ247 TaxID=2726188 RepID=UPI0016292B92|nr:GNAT family N-acetyltransferase [Clostridium sp. DJ247]MBC2581365.1 GNAT family N-acetyltransferase [Clostridium sp. DJ247]